MTTLRTHPELALCAAFIIAALIGHAAALLGF
jgi:hypothetical protein